jgi:hypothetical protein
VVNSLPLFFIPALSELPTPALSFWTGFLLLAPLFLIGLLPAAHGSQFLGLWERSSCIRQHLLAVYLCLVPRLLAVAELLFFLPVAVVPQGLAVVWGLRARWDPLAMGKEELVKVAAVATLT